MVIGKSRKLLGVITLVAMLLSVLPMQVMAADSSSTVTVQPTAQVQNQTGSAKNNSTINPFWYMQAYGSSNNAQNKSIGNNDGAIYAVKDPVQEALASVTNDYLQPAANGSSVSKSTFLGDPGTTNVTGTVIDPVTNLSVQTVTRLEVRYWDSTGSYWKRYYTDTQADGSFELYLAQGSYAILANPDMSSPYGQSQAAEITIDGTGNASPSNISLTLANQNIISGTVQDGYAYPNPVANAKVVMSYSDRPPQNPNDGFTKTRIFETDQSGNYKIGSLSDGYYIFRADAGDSGKSYKMEVLVSGGVGTITDGQLQPDGLGQLTIHPFNLEGQVNIPDNSPGAPVKRVEILPTQGHLGYSANIDSQGNYREVVPPGEYTVQALAAVNSGYTNSLRYWINVTYPFYLDLNLTTAKITGTVNDVGGTPAGGARVEIRSGKGGPTLDYTYADANGQYSLGGFDGNQDYRITVYYNNKQFTTNTFSVPFNGPVNIQIKDPNVSGNVVDPQGTTPQPAEIIIDQANGDYFASYYGTYTENGDFAVYLDPGEYYITASPKGISGYARSMSKKITVTESETVTIPPIKLTTPIITGYVNLNGISVPNAEVNIDFQGKDTENGFVDHVRTRTMDDGKFLLGGFNPGKYTLSVDSEQGNKKVNLEVVGTRTVNLNLNPVNVNGTVYMPNGQPASGVSVFFNITDGTSEVGDLTPVNHVRVLTDNDGNYRYGLEQNCNYILQARPDPKDSRYSSYTNSQRIWFSTYSGNSFDLTLTTPKVKGIVSDQNNNPVPHAWVEIKMPWAGPYDTNVDAVETDETGHYQLGGVDPYQNNMYSIQAYSNSLNSPKYYVELDPNAVITQDIVIQPPNVKGQVFDTDGSTPYQGQAWISIFSIDNNNYDGAPVRQDSSFELNLPRGNYYAKVYADTAGNENMRTSPQLLTVGSGISTLSFTLRDVVSNPQVIVTVKDANGNIMPVEIQVAPATTAVNEELNDWPFFDNGTAYFGGLADIDYNLFIKYPFGYRKLPVKVVNGVATPSEITLSIDNTTNISGTVTEADGQTPVPSYYLGIQPKELDQNYGVAAGAGNGSYPYNGQFDYVQSANGGFNIFLDDGEYNLIATRQTDKISKASQGISTITVQGGQIIAGSASIKMPPMVPKFVELQPLAPAHMDQFFHYELDFIGGRPWYSMNIENQPNWLNIGWDDWQGKIWFDGVPSNTDVGIHSFAINLTDSNGKLASKKLSVLVEGSSPYSVFIDNMYPMEAKAGKPFVYQLVAKNGTTPYTWQASGLPTWLTLDVNTGVLTGTPPTTAVGPNNFQVSVTDSTNQTMSQNYILIVNPTMYYAIPKITVGEDPNLSGNAGLDIGIEKFMDESNTELPDAKIAGYVMTLRYPMGAMSLADPIDAAKLGGTSTLENPSMFTFNNDKNSGTLTVSNALPTGTLDYHKLFFIPMTVNSPADALTNLQIQFEDVQIIPDGNSIDSVPVRMSMMPVLVPGPVPIPMPIPIPMMPITFQRGKILNSNQMDPMNPMNLPRVTDAIAGLQYLVGMRAAGLAPGQVNVVNMASIIPSDTGVSRPSVTGIVSLLQYLAKLRDNNFSVK